MDLAHTTYGYLTAHATLEYPALGVLMLVSYILYQVLNGLAGGEGALTKEVVEELREDVLEFTVGVALRVALVALGW